MSDYQVLFNGVVVEGDDVAVVERKLALALDVEPARAKRLFNGRTVVLASALTRDQAIELQNKLQSVGAITRIKDLAPKSSLSDHSDSPANDAEGSMLRDLTAAHIECPRCGHMQLDAQHCSRCGVDIEVLFRKRRKQELLMEKKLRDHRAAQQKRLEQAAGDEDSHDFETGQDGAHGPRRTGPSLKKETREGFFSRLFRRSA